MPLNPGVLTLTFNPPGQFVVDKFHTVPASSGLTAFDQPGCSVQSATVKDKVDNTAYAEATDKIFTPFNTNIQGVFAEWYIVPPWGGGAVKFRILGVHNTRDQWGRALQGEFIVKKETG